MNGDGGQLALPLRRLGLEASNFLAHCSRFFLSAEFLQYPRLQLERFGVATTDQGPIDRDVRPFEGKLELDFVGEKVVRRV